MQVKYHLITISSIIDYLIGINIILFVLLKIYGLCHTKLSHYLLLVGKTSLITRFMYDSFDNTYQVWVTINNTSVMCP